jgi:hypothetical protein
MTGYKATASLGNLAGSQNLLLNKLTPAPVSKDSIFVVCASGDSTAYTLTGNLGSWTAVVSAGYSNGTLRVIQRVLTDTDITNGYVGVTIGRNSDTFMVLGDSSISLFDGNTTLPLAASAYGVRNGVSQAFTDFPGVTSATSTYGLIFGIERSAALTTTAVPTAGTQDYFLDPASTLLNSLFVGHIALTPGTPSGANRITYNASSGNGIAFILPMLPAVVSVPSSGQQSSSSISWFGTSFLRGSWMLTSSAGATLRMAASTSPSMSAPVYSAPFISSASNWATQRLNGLNPNTVYYVGIEINGVLQTDGIVKAKTLPTAGSPASYGVTVVSCQRTGSNHASLAQVAAEVSDYTVHQGDLHYGDATTVADWRAAVLSSMSTANMKLATQSKPMYWSWDNHDGVGGNSGYGGLAAWPAVQAAYREYTGDLPASDTANRSWTHGRVGWIRTDHWAVRSNATDAESSTKTMLGATQLQWWKDALLAMDASSLPVIMWVSGWPASKIANGRWGSFTTETSAMEAWLAAHPYIRRKIIMIGGDSHDIRADSGTRVANFGGGGIPSLNASPLDQSGGPFDTANWDIGQIDQETSPFQRGYIGRLAFTDDSTKVNVSWTAVRDDGTVMLSWNKDYAGVIPTPGIEVWDGTVSRPARLSWWDGTTERPISSYSIT